MDWISPIIILFLQKNLIKNEDEILLNYLKECYIESLKDPLYLKFNSKF